MSALIRGRARAPLPAIIGTVVEGRDLGTVALGGAGDWLRVHPDVVAGFAIRAAADGKPGCFTDVRGSTWSLRLAVPGAIRPTPASKVPAHA